MIKVLVNLLKLKHTDCYSNAQKYSILFVFPKNNKKRLVCKERQSQPFYFILSNYL